MTPEILQILSEMGIGAVALFMFYKIVTKQADRHRQERKEDSHLWRTEIKETHTMMREKSEKTDKVIEELTAVIRDINRSDVK